MCHLSGDAAAGRQPGWVRRLRLTRLTRLAPGSSGLPGARRPGRGQGCGLWSGVSSVPTCRVRCGHSARYKWHPLGRRHPKVDLEVEPSVAGTGHYGVAAPVRHLAALAGWSGGRHPGSSGARCRAELAGQGNVAAAARWTERGPEPGPQAGYALEQKYLVLVRGVPAQRFPPRAITEGSVRSQPNNLPVGGGQIFGDRRGAPGHSGARCVISEGRRRARGPAFVGDGWAVKARQVGDRADWPFWAGAAAVRCWAGPGGVWRRHGSPGQRPRGPPVSGWRR